MIVAAITLAVVIIAPWLLGSLLSEILATTAIFLLMGLGLNIVVGFAGLLDLGYVAFFAVGAYTSAILTSPLSPFFAPEWPWWYTLPVVVVVGALAGIFVGTPVIRLRGDYLAIVTLGFGEIVRITFLSDAASPWFGGAGGIRNIPGIPLGFDTVSGSDPEYILYFAVALVLLAAWVSYALLNSRVGRAWTAMREDESVAEVMGIDTVRAKLSAFVVGAVLASLGGALFSAKLGSIFPTSFELLISIVILVIVIVGGMGNIVGVAAGAVVLIGVLGGPRQPGLLQEFGEFKLLIYGVILVYMMLKRPEGLVPNVRRSRELHHEEMAQDAWLKAQAEEAAGEAVT
ncbi:MAG: branched-chain amino acid ABC transporter permease [Acidimicrobiia bacterium]|nr:branched-chain amino acid ABC transporter permease [Acidimicrobiia bacterium]